MSLCINSCGPAAKQSRHRPGLYSGGASCKEHTTHLDALIHIKFMACSDDFGGGKKKKKLINWDSKSAFCNLYFLLFIFPVLWQHILSFHFSLSAVNKSMCEVFFYWKVNNTNIVKCLFVPFTFQNSTSDTNFSYPFTCPANSLLKIKAHWEMRDF